MLLGQALRQGHLPWWTPDELLGVPVFACLQGGALYPPNWLYILPPSWLVYNFSLVVHYLATALFAREYARSEGMSEAGALVTGLLWAFFGFCMVHLDHVPLLDAAAWLPLILLLVDRVARRLAWGDAVLLGMVVAVQVYAGHLQVVYLTALTAFLRAAYVVSNRSERRAQAVGLLLLASVLGLALAAPQLVATARQAEQSVRVEAHKLLDIYSFPPVQSIQMIAPFAFGGGFAMPYWGSWNLVEMTPFLGIFGCVGGVVGALHGGRGKRFWLALAVASFLAALGSHTPLWAVFGPLAELFHARIPARHFLEMGFSVSLLAGYGLDAILEKGGARRTAIITACVLAVPLLVYALDGARWADRALRAGMLFPTFSPRPDGFFHGFQPCLWVPVAFLAVYLGALLLAKSHLPHVLMGVMVLEAASFMQASTPHLPSGQRLQAWLRQPLNAWLAGHLVDGERAFWAWPPGQEAFPLYTLPLHLRALNGYEPLMDRTVAEYLDLLKVEDTNSVAPFDLRLDALAVRYVVVPADADLPPPATDARTVKQMPVSLEGFPPPGVVLPLYRDRSGLHVLEGQARLAGGNWYALTYQGAAPQVLSQGVDVRLSVDGGVAFHDDSPRFAPDPRTFYHVFYARTSGPVRVSLFSVSDQPVLVQNISIERLDGYPPARSGTTLVYAAQGRRVYQRPGAVPLVFFPRTTVTLSSTSEVARLFGLGLADPRDTVAVVAPEPLQAQYGAARLISLALGDTRMEATVQADGPALMVVAQQYDPDWHAEVDGTPTVVHRVNGAEQAVALVPGLHHVVLWYEAGPVRMALWASLAALCMSLAVLWRIGFPRGPVQ